MKRKRADKRFSEAPSFFYCFFLCLFVSSTPSPLSYHFTMPFLSMSLSGTSSVSGKPVVKGWTGWCSAATAGQGAGGGHLGGTEQTPAVHVLPAEIWHGGAATGKEIINSTNCSGKLSVEFGNSSVLHEHELKPVACLCILSILPVV